MTVVEQARTIWRSVRERGWRAVISVMLLAVALAANTIVFSAVDSFVFNRVPYSQADRLVEIADRDPRTGTVGSAFISAATLDEWRRQKDVFASVQGYLTKTAFLTGSRTVQLQMADVTPGLLELLGANPKWGRTLNDADAAQIDPQVVVISEGLAREHFGDPARALAQTLATAVRPMVVVGVMPAGFEFPVPGIRIWRAMDPRGPLTKGFDGVDNIARLATGIPFSTARAIVEQRASGVGHASASREPYNATLSSLPIATSPDTQRRLFLIILGTAICLLLTACANVAGLEIAAAIPRAKSYAIHLALGAERRRLVAASLAEGLLMVGTAASVAFVAARTGGIALAKYMSERLAYSLNPIHIDGRVLGYLSIAAFVTWLFGSLPVAFFATRADVSELLKHGGPATAPPRASHLRGVLTIAEIAVAVVLLIATVLYARTYFDLVGLDKGFETHDVAVVTVSLPVHVYPGSSAKRAFAATLLGRLKAAHVIIDGTWGTPPPSVGSRTHAHLQVDDASAEGDETWIGEMQVDSSYFSTLGIPLRRGRVSPAVMTLGARSSTNEWPRGCGRRKILSVMSFARAREGGGSTSWVSSVTCVPSSMLPNNSVAAPCRSTIHLRRPPVQRKGLSPALPPLTTAAAPTASSI